MRSLVWTNAFPGLAFVALSLTSYIFANTKFIPESPPRDHTTNHRDSGHRALRKVALLLVHGNDEVVRKTNQSFVSGIQSIGWLAVLHVRNFFVANTPTMLKAIRVAGGRDQRRVTRETG